MMKVVYLYLAGINVMAGLILPFRGINAFNLGVAVILFGAFIHTILEEAVERLLDWT